MAAAAKASQPGYTGVTVYVAEDVWKQLRRDAMEDEGTTASALGAALMEFYAAGRLSEAAAVRARAVEITQRRRKRAD